MSFKRQQLNFNQDFIFSTIKDWKNAAEKYDQAAKNHYKRIRSYLTLWQFRLSDEQKCEIREKLAQDLDEITANDFVQDLDSYLEGFCFQLDKSVIPNNHSIQPNEVKIAVAPKPVTEIPSHSPAQVTSQENFSESEISQTIDCNDLDYYTLQFFQ